MCVRLLSSDGWNWTGGMSAGRYRYYWQFSWVSRILVPLSLFGNCGGNVVLWHRMLTLYFQTGFFFLNYCHLLWRTFPLSSIAWLDETLISRCRLVFSVNVQGMISAVCDLASQHFTHIAQNFHCYSFSDNKQNIMCWSHVFVTAYKIIRLNRSFPVFLTLLLQVYIKWR